MINFKTKRERANKEQDYLDKLRTELADVSDFSLRPGRLADSLKALSGFFQPNVELPCGSHINSLLWLLADEARAIELRIMIEAQERHMRDSQSQAAPC